MWGTWKDPEEGPWLDRWHRRGELLLLIGLTGGITWLSSAVPTQAQTHVDIWPPVGVFAGIALLGIYVLLAAEVDWWLPGRKRFTKESERRYMEDMFSGDTPAVKTMNKFLQEGKVDEAIDLLTRLVEAIERLEPDPPFGKGESYAASRSGSKSTSTTAPSREGT